MPCFCRGPLRKERGGRQGVTVFQKEKGQGISKNWRGTVVFYICTRAVDNHKSKKETKGKPIIANPEQKYQGQSQTLR